jgi:hypothetical protein
MTFQVISSGALLHFYGFRRAHMKTIVKNKCAQVTRRLWRALSVPRCCFLTAMFALDGSGALARKWTSAADAGL